MNIKVIGVGSIGVFLINALTESNHSVSVLDSRFKQKHKILTAQIDGMYRTLNVESFHQLSQYDELIIVTLKSYQIDTEILSMLTESKNEVLFLQNGISKYLVRDQEIGRFHYGTILGIQAYREQENTFISTQNCSIAVIPGTERTQLEQLSASLSSKTLQFESWEKSKNIYFEKFLRWFVASLVVSIQRKPLGESLALIGDYDLNVLIHALVELVYLELQISISVESIRLALNNLPPNLLTSAARDFFSTRENEMQVELDYLIERSRILKLDSDIFKSWKERLNYV